jgi:capsular polysaccharide biosynthesis protein
MSPRRARSLTDYYRAASRHKLLLVTPALVVAIAVAVALSRVPALYKSTAMVAISNSKNTDSSPENYLKDFRQRLTSRENLESLVQRSSSRDESLDVVFKKIRQRISVELAPAPNSLSVSYRAEDPETARKVTEELASRLTSSQAEPAQKRDSSLDGLRTRAEEISRRMRELEEREPRLALDADYPSDSSQPVRTAQPSAEFIRAQQMTIEGLKDQQYKFQQELAEVERRIGEQRKIVDQQSKGSTLRDNPTYASLITRRAELRGQRDTLINRQELTDKHPRVLAINDQIAAIDRQIEDLRRQDTALVNQSPEARELASLFSERNRLKIELEVTDRELARRSTNQSTAAAPPPQQVHRDINTSGLAKEYQSLKRTQKEVDEQIQAAEAKTSKDVPSAATLQLTKPADLPTTPISPERPLFISIAAAVGLALGAIFVLVAESTRFNSLQDARDVEYYTRLPLLAAIPKSVTAQERRSARWRANGRIILGSAAALAITFALSRFFIVFDIFSLITKN